MSDEKINDGKCPVCRDPFYGGPRFYLRERLAQLLAELLAEPFTAEESRAAGQSSASYVLAGRVLTALDKVGLLMPPGGETREERSHIHWGARGVRGCPPNCDAPDNVKRTITDWPARQQYNGDRLITGWERIDEYDHDSEAPFDDD